MKGEAYCTALARPNWRFVRACHNWWEKAYFPQGNGWAVSEVPALMLGSQLMIACRKHATHLRHRMLAHAASSGLRRVAQLLCARLEACRAICFPEQVI